MIRLPLVFVCALLLAAVGFAFYWQSKLSPIMESAAARLAPTRFELVVVSKTKSLNLGYEQVSIPETLSGELIRFKGTNVVALPEAKGALSKICFMPPPDFADPQSIASFKSIAALAGTPVKTWYDFNKQLLNQRPISIWQLFSLGVPQFKGRLYLLALKGLVFSRTASVRIFENERVGLIVRNEPEFVMVTLADLKTGLSQEILIFPLVKNIDEVISAMAGDFELNLPGTDERAIARLIDSVGMMVVAESAPSSAAETQWYDAARQEIQRRRLLREQSGKP